MILDGSEVTGINEEWKENNEALLTVTNQLLANKNEQIIQLTEMVNLQKKIITMLEEQIRGV